MPLRCACGLMLQFQLSYLPTRLSFSFLFLIPSEKCCSLFLGGPFIIPAVYLHLPTGVQFLQDGIHLASSHANDMSCTDTWKLSPFPVYQHQHSAFENVLQHVNMSTTAMWIKSLDVSVTVFFCFFFTYKYYIFNISQRKQNTLSLSLLLSLSSHMHWHTIFQQWFCEKPS